MSINPWIEIFGARENNLKNIDVRIPRYKLTVITGVSGSGKSSLAFNTLYQEGQRRYFETFNLYTRQFLGEMYKPDVDIIKGLSPVIAIDQKNIIHNPRSTVGTVTEIYDFLRLLYARIAVAYSSATGKPMTKFTEQQLIEKIIKDYDGEKIQILAPLVKGRKGHYGELFASLFEKGYVYCRIDGETVELSPRLKLDRYKIHDIELIIDKFTIDKSQEKRVKEAVEQALKMGKGTLAVQIVGENELRYFSKDFMCEESGFSLPAPEPNTFSFNSPYGACPHCNGLGYIYDVDLSKIIPDPELSIRQGGIAPLGPYKNNYLFYIIDKILYHFKATLDDPIKTLSDEALQSILYGFDDVIHYYSSIAQVYETIPIQFEGIINLLKEQNEENSYEIKRWTHQYIKEISCPVCKGTRLKKESLLYKIDGYDIAQVSSWQLQNFYQWIKDLPQVLTKSQQAIASDILDEISKRTDLLLNIGLSYLSLNRPSKSLSGGESQRIRLASQIGSGLSNVLYILDEPSIGLHASDNEKLIASLKALRDKRNTVVVIEHDEETMLSADYIIDMGPGAGSKGGKVVAAGPPQEMINCDSLTCQYLSGKKQIPIPSQRRKPGEDWLIIRGARGHNLKDITVSFPLGLFICVTGVSGSGKSSLINQTLVPALQQRLNPQYTQEPLPFSSIEGIEKVNKVIPIDQSPIGRTPRSNPATYTGVFDEIRKLFAQLPESIAHGYKPNRFSFNVGGGRCEHCKGAGEITIEMNFLPDMHVVCPVCNGKRYNEQTLSIRFKGKSIYDVLNMTIEEAVIFFENQPIIYHYLHTLYDIGLGYIRLGQSSTTLSGGEAQRIKLATEFAKKSKGHTIYVLDEPTTGLHFEDVKILLKLLTSLVEKGHTVIVIEHHMDVIAYADYIIDLGPGGGDKGGYVVTAGSPEEIMQHPESLTGSYLAKHLHNKIKSFTYEQL
jgi:excinuclease ABC subunit A